MNIKDDNAVMLVRGILRDTHTSDYAKLCLMYSVLEQSEIDTTHIFGHHGDGRSAGKVFLKIFHQEGEVENPFDKSN